MPFAVKASAMFSCDITGPSRGTVPLAAIACGLNGLVAGELTKLVFRECWIPCTIDVWRWCPYESEGFRSTARSGLELLLPTSTTGVWERGDIVRPEEVSALPRVTEGWAEGFSEWCDGAAPPACGRGDAAAISRSTKDSQDSRMMKIEACKE